MQETTSYSTDIGARMFIIILSTSIFTFFIVGLITLLISTANKTGKWGINTEKCLCPKCGMTMPIIRRPQNLRQFLWGGSTCKGCGCEVDKWGREITRKP